MKRDAAEVLKEALALPPEDGAALAESLLASLDAHADEGAEAAWATEIDRRVAELDAGTARMIRWPEVRQRLFERARHGAADSNQPPEACSWSLSWRGHVLEAGFGRGRHFPQYVAFHADSGFLRLNGGPGSDWGTSIVVLSSFWEAGRYHQGAPISVTSRASQSSLIMSFSGFVSRLHVLGEVHLRHPETDGIACDVWVRVEGDVKLDRRPAETFKPVFGSSMHVSSERWDVESIRIDSRRFAIPEGGWIVEPAAKGRRIILNGGSSKWKRRAPSLEVELDDCMETAGWKTPSTDPDHDNIGVWAAADHVMRRWHYVIRARM